MTKRSDTREGGEGPLRSQTIEHQQENIRGKGVKEPIKSRENKAVLHIGTLIQVFLLKIKSGFVGCSSGKGAREKKKTHEEGKGARRRKEEQGADLDSI